MPNDETVGTNANMNGVARISSGSRVKLWELSQNRTIRTVSGKAGPHKKLRINLLT